MTLEFEKLSAEIRTMSSTTLRREHQRALQTENWLATMNTYATQWQWIEQVLAQAEAILDPQSYRAARPIEYDEALNCGIDVPDCPTHATIIAIDGSQIVPDRHAPFLYSLLNTGIIIYHHGQPIAPEIKSVPILQFPGEDLEEDTLMQFTTPAVSVQRDLQEMGQLARTVVEHRYDRAPIVALMDQRLFYWPIGAVSGPDSIVNEWLSGMNAIKMAGGILAGYVVRPNSVAVLNLVRTMQLGNPNFDEQTLIRRPTGMTDSDLFSIILKPRQRSKVFATLDNSLRNAKFKAANQEVCFFYFRPNHTSEIARIDIPLWAAQQPEVIAQIHALLDSQCQILGGYPYVLTRADEIAVVGRKDQEYLNRAIELEMQRNGVDGSLTNKQASKNYSSRAGRTRHEP